MNTCPHDFCILFIFIWKNFDQTLLLLISWISKIMGKISLIIGIFIGIIFSVAFPEVAQTINDAIMPIIQSLSEKFVDWI
jgi:hypothetical protein